MLMSIFDKSFIHAINADEAAVFDVHFMSNITPLFFVEVLADLEKTNLESGREALVKSLAGKTPDWRSYANIPHHDLVAMELMGHPIELRRVPAIRGGRKVHTSDGPGTIFDEFPELKAKSRWRAGVFGPEEYATARAWRAMLQAAPTQAAGLLSGSANRFTFADLSAVKRYVDQIVDPDNSRFGTLKGALELLGVSAEAQGDIVTRWKAAGGPPLREFAPYTAHVVSVDLFRLLAMASGLISIDKSSNFADIAYLHYLPFCEIFVSSDKLHRRCVPLFLAHGQAFVWGPDLRPHLAALVEGYLKEPDIETAGLVGVSERTKFPAGTFIGDLVRQLHPHYDDSYRENLASKLTPEAARTILARVAEARAAPAVDPGHSPEEEDKVTTVRRQKF